MKKELQRLLTVLMDGNREEVKDAKKEIEKLFHKRSQKFEKDTLVVFDYMARFDKIEKTENKAAFASGLSMFFLILADHHFDIFKDFTLKLLQNPNGTVREAIRKTAEWLFISLTARADPFIYPKGNKLTEKQKREQAEARQQYVSLVKEVEFLIDKYDKRDEAAQYINEMKPSINKSLQFFWSRLTESRAYREILEAAWPASPEIIQKRNEIEGKFKGIFKDAKVGFDFEDVKDIIYDEDGSESFNELISLVTKKGSLVELESLLELMNDAWNYFPHKSLDGLSPTEMIRMTNIKSITS